MNHWIFLFYDLYYIFFITEKFKPNEIKIENKLDDNVITLFKLELESILSNTKILNEIIEDIQPYGSRISGLFTDDSDVDFHVSYSKYYL